MVNPQPSQTFRGTWEQLASHKDEIPPDAMLELKVFELQPEVDEEIGDFGGKSIYEVFKDVIGTVSFEPTDVARRAEEYLEGFGETKNRRTLTP